MNKTKLNFWSKLLRRLKLTDSKKRSYTTNKPDLISVAYTILFYLIALFYIYKTLTNTQSALPLLIIFPAFIGIFFFYFVLPIRFLNSVIIQTMTFIYLSKIKKNTPSKTVIVTGKSDYKSLSFWFSPNYGLDIIYLLKFLKLKGEDFSFYKNVDIKTFDEIMSNTKITTVYIVGHGRRHGFAIDAETAVDYCRYNDPKYKKNYVYQIHCNQQKGTSLVEYVVDEKNKAECLPEHGYFSNFGINRMFIDKIIEFKKYGKWKSIFAKLLYNSLPILVIYLTLLIWILIFTKIIG